VPSPGSLRFIQAYNYQLATGSDENSLRILFGNIPWSQIKDIITSLGVLGAFVLGILGLNTWRRQLQGTSKYDVARRAVLHAYKVQEAIEIVRNPSMSLPKKDVDEGRQVSAEMKVYEARMGTLQDRRAELKTVIFEARALWGTEVDVCYKSLEQIIRELRGAIWLHFWMKGAYAGPGTTVDNNPARVKGNDEIVYQVSDDDNFSKKVDAAVQQVLLFFEKHIK
jgi:hypothetical protein